MLNVDGIKIISIDKQISNKIATLEGRTKARDLYDTNFLLRKCPERFTPDQLNRLENICSDMDSLYSQYATIFEDDLILGKTGMNVDLESLILDTQARVEKLIIDPYIQEKKTPLSFKDKLYKEIKLLEIQST